MLKKRPALVGAVLALLSCAAFAQGTLNVPSPNHGYQTSGTTDRTPLSGYAVETPKEGMGVPGGRAPTQPVTGQTAGAPQGKSGAAAAGRDQAGARPAHPQSVHPQKLLNHESVVPAGAGKGIGEKGLKRSADR
jgi:hypothetical protein